MNTNTDNETSDYGEPWHEDAGSDVISTCRGSIVLYTASDMDEPYRSRAIACVNACAGMADPAAELAAMREAIKEAEVAINSVMDIMQNSQGVVGWHLNGEIASWDELDLHSVTQYALDRLQPFIK